MARNQRRHKTGFGYGTTANNKKSRAVFSEIKYRMNTASLKTKVVEFDSETLSAADRIEIKNKIRKSNKEKTFRILLITVISVIILIIIAIEIIEGALFRH